MCLGFQNYFQLIRDYCDKEARVIQNTVGNIFSGQVVGETTKSLFERFGKVLQKRQSMPSTVMISQLQLSTQLDSHILVSKISTLTQGRFIGAVSDNFEERIEQKIVSIGVKSNWEDGLRTDVYETSIPKAFGSGVRGSPC